MIVPQSEWSLTARWVIPVDGPPLAGGTVTVRGDRITAVEPHGSRTADLDLGNTALLPGFVNAHTHLDLSGLRGQCPPTPDFTHWLRQVIAHRRATTAEQTQADIRAGLAEALRYGTTLVGDIAFSGASWEVLAGSPVRAVVFLELIGLPLERAQQALATAETWLATHRPSPICRAGLSPHAPYSVRPFLFGQASLLAGKFRAPLAVHLAETFAEIELLVFRRGPFVPFLQELGVWTPGSLARHPSDVIQACNRRRVPKLFIHGNYLTPRAGIPRSATIVYCPRTHAAFGHPPHPFRDFLAQGIRVALGTDSLASNPDLDLLAEARFVHARYPDVPGDMLLRLATLSGAEALGWADETGSLTPGKSADLVVLPLPDEDASDPYRLVLTSTTAVRGVLCRGQWLSPPVELRR